MLKPSSVLTVKEDKTATFRTKKGEKVSFSPEDISNGISVLKKKRSQTAVKAYLNNTKYMQIAEQINLSKQYTRKIIRNSITEICEFIHDNGEVPKPEVKSEPEYEKIQIWDDSKSTGEIGIQPTENCKACGKKIETDDDHLCINCRRELDDTSNYIACPDCGKQRHKILLDYHDWKCPNCKANISKEKRPVRT